MDSFIGWVGGKRLLRKEILKRFPTEGVDRYIEVFGGAGWVLFGKEEVKGQLEVYNDFDGNLVNLFRCVKYHCGELQRELQWLSSSRELFETYREQINAPGMTDIQRAARYFYLIKASFSSNRDSFKTSNFNLSRATAYLAEVTHRLENVVIENRDFERLIRIYDRPKALLYLDPPYHGAEGFYAPPFDEKDHQRLKTVLSSVKGRFILSYNDDPFIRELYSGFNIQSVSRNQNLSSNGQEYREVIICNF